MMTHQGSETLAQAVSGEPTAQWTDSSGQLWTTKEILDGYPPEKLERRVRWGEGQMGMPSIVSADGNSEVLLTMEPPTGEDILPEPAVEPES